MAPKKNPKKVMQASKKAAEIKTKAKVALDHIFQVKNSYEALKPTYTPGADRAIAHIQLQDPGFPPRRDSARGLLSEIEECKSVGDIFPTRGAGKGKTRTTRALETHPASGQGLPPLGPKLERQFPASDG